uniref:Uncharacterized protein n=1 Tax=Ficedula albicollis TaxID=59894 RepID=A0A803WB67_FICAL
QKKDLSRAGISSVLRHVVPKTSSAVGTAPAQGLSLYARLTQTTHMSTDSCSPRPSTSRAWHWLYSTVIMGWEICKDLVTTPRVPFHVNYTLSRNTPFLAFGWSALPSTQFFPHG